MKKVKVYEFKDLTKDTQEKTRIRELNATIELNIEVLNLQLEKKFITENEYFIQLGCTKSYAESTSWFISSCYYEKHKKLFDTQLDLFLKKQIYDKYGYIIKLD